MKQIMFLSIILSFLSCFINNKEVLAFQSISNVSITPRVIGGEDADITDFPYMASLRVFDRYFCSASSIGETDLLGAAHCFTHTNDVIWPYIGVFAYTGTSSSVEIGIMHRIAKVTVHPGWTGNGVLRHDIVHVKLVASDKIIFDEYQRLVRLPRHNVVSNLWGWVTGWGYVVINVPPTPEQMKKLKMWTLKYTDCQRFMPPQLVLHPEQLCVYQQQGQGCAIGDSGAPLVINTFVVGIHSWIIGVSCAVGEPEVFVNIFLERDFLHLAMNAN